MFSDIFIRRPILATVSSLLLAPLVVIDLLHV